jgi:hypothetical protein
MSSSATLQLCTLVCLFASLAGCGGQDAPPSPSTAASQAAADKDAQSRAWLVKVGTWRRELPFVTYETTFAPDGSLTMREEARPPGGAPTTKTWHGRFQIADGRITYHTSLPNDDPLVLHFTIERVTASEFIQSTVGPLGKTEQRYVPAR